LSSAPIGIAPPGGDSPEERIGAEGAHLEEEGAAPQALQPRDLLGLGVQVQHEHEAEGRLATRPRCPGRDRLGPLAPQRLSGRAIGPRRPHTMSGDDLPF
jgi:hypothetical protein